MQVKYSVEDTIDKGKGLISKQFIKKGTLIYKVTNNNYYVFSSSKQAIETVGEVVYTRVLETAVGYLNQSILYVHDDGQYFNHSDNPNCGFTNNADYQSIESTKDVNLYALRDIKIDEELTESYSKYLYPTWHIEELERFDLLPMYCKLPYQI